MSLSLFVRSSVSKITRKLLINFTSLHRLTKMSTIGVRAQSTLGGARHFCPQNMYEKLTKCPNFTWFLSENARILHNNCRKKIFFPISLGWGDVPPRFSTVYQLGVANYNTDLGGGLNSRSAFKHDFVTLTRRYIQINTPTVIHNSTYINIEIMSKNQ